MALYAWKGIDGKGKPISGTKDADGPKGLRLALRKEGVFLVELREVRAGAVKGVKRQAGSTNTSALKRDVDLKRLFERVRAQDVAVFTRQLATLLKAGIPLAEGLGALCEQSSNHTFETILAEIRQRVNEGGSLAEAMGLHPAVFPTLYTNMVRSGEASGNLDSVLARLADFLDAQHALRTKVQGAIFYPVIMMVLGSVIVGILMVVVVPKITDVFEDMGKALPWNTRLLIFAADIASNYWWALIVAMGGGIWGARRWARTAFGRNFLDRQWLRLPVVGSLLRFVAVARFARTLATMLASGVPVLTALEIVKKVLNNTVLEKVVEEARDAIREGESIAAPLKRSKQFPPMMCHMVAVGERSGQLEAMLENVATAYERDVEAKMARLTTLLEPLMIVAMAVGVGFIVFSILSPILDMQQFAQ